MLRALNACQTLSDADIEPTRDLIAEKTGMKLVTVDEAIKKLRQLGLIERKPQCYRPVIQHAPDRATSISSLTDGMVKLEVGDEVLSLTPSEARKVGMGLMGYANDFSGLANQRSMMERISRLEHENQRMKLDLRKRTAESAQQPLI